MNLLMTTVLSALLSATTATTTAPLTLEEVLRRADTFHPTVLMADADVEAADGAALAADGAFDPMLRLAGGAGAGNYQSATADTGVSALTPLWGTRVEGGWRAGVGDYPTYYGEKKTNDFGEFRAGLRVPLLRDGAIDSARAGVQQAALQQTLRAEGFRAARLETARDAAKAYWDWVVAGAKHQVALDLLALAKVREDQLRTRAAAGDLPPMDVVDNARLIASRQSRVISARRGVERAALTLALSLRDDEGRPTPPTLAMLPAIPRVDVADSDVVNDDDDAIRAGVAALLQEALDRRPEARRARLALAQLDVDRDLADNQTLPGLSLIAGISQDVGGTHDPLSSSSSVWNPDPKTRALPEGSVGLSFELPIPQRAARGKRAQVGAAVNRANASLQLVADRIALEVQDGLQAQRAARQRAVTTHVEVDAAEAVSTGERQRYEAGDSTLVVVNLREVAAAEASLAAAEARVDVARAEVLLGLVTGRLLDED